GGAENSSHVRRREPFDVAQQDRHLLFLRQAVQGFPKPLALLFPGEPGIGIGHAAWSFVLRGRDFAERVVPALVLALKIAANIDRNPHQPWLSGAPARA